MGRIRLRARRGADADRRGALPGGAGPSGEAVEVARDARDVFERLGARPALAEVDALTGALAQTS